MLTSRRRPSQRIIPVPCLIMAKDATKLFEAIDLKMAEQRRFLFWWYGQKKNPGGNPLQTSNGLLPSEIATLADLVSSHPEVR